MFGEVEVPFLSILEKKILCVVYATGHENEKEDERYVLEQQLYT